MDARRPRRPIKGSWEALLQEASELSDHKDDNAIAIYRKLIDRLVSFSPDRRGASGGHLQDILEEAVFSLQSYLASKGQFEKVVAVLTPELAAAAREESLIEWQDRTARAYRWMGQVDEAVALWRDVGSMDPEDFSHWWQIFTAYLWAGRSGEAQQVLAEAEAFMHESDSIGPDEGKEFVAALHLEWARYFRHWMEVVRYGNQVLQLATPGMRSAANIYRPLIWNHQFELAALILEQEESRPLVDFWRGVIHLYQGQRSAAEQQWHRLIERDVAEQEISGAIYWILAHFYLGDRERLGLELCIRLLDAAETTLPSLTALTSLGWALHGQWSPVHSNLGFALSAARSDFTDNLLPVTLRYSFQDLLEPKDFARVRHYFHEPRYAQRSEDETESANP